MYTNNVNSGFHLEQLFPLSKRAVIFKSSVFLACPSAAAYLSRVQSGQKWPVSIGHSVDSGSGPDPGSRWSAPARQADSSHRLRAGERRTEGRYRWAVQTTRRPHTSLRQSLAERALLGRSEHTYLHFV